MHNVPDYAPLCAPPDRTPRVPRLRSRAAPATPMPTCSGRPRNSPYADGAHLHAAGFDLDRLPRTCWTRSASIAPCWCSRASTAPTMPRCWRRSRPVGAGLRAVAVADPEISGARAGRICIAPACAACASTWSTGATPATSCRPRCCSAIAAPHRAARLAYRAPGQSRRGERIRRRCRRHSGSDRARPHGLSALRRAHLAAGIRPSPICCGSSKPAAAGSS